MRFLVFQHLTIEHPGVFRNFFTEAGIEWDVVELDQGQPIPDLSRYDALWVMGGPMDVWEMDDHPWLVAEKAAIREAVKDRGMPYFGCCLGHQLLADALGGECSKLAQPEIGIFEVELNAAGLADPLFSGLPPVCEVLQWHGVEVTEIPSGGAVLAQSTACAVQALRIDKHAYGIQFHIEMTDTTIQEWGAEPGCRRTLENALGPGAFDTIDTECAARSSIFEDTARRLFDNFIGLVRDYRA